MCGRYVVEGVQELSERFQLRHVRLHLDPNFNAAPTQLLPVILENEAGERELQLMQWGLVPKWSRPGGKSVQPINARSETLWDKPMFKPLVGKKRCIVPANGYYEWRQEGSSKQPYYLTKAESGLFGFAGLYDSTTTGAEDGPPTEAAGSYTIITTSADERISFLHERMPVILRPEHEADWLSRDVTDPAEIEQLLAPLPADQLDFFPVSRAVNNVRHHGADLIKPLPEDDEAAGA